MTKEFEKKGFNLFDFRWILFLLLIVGMLFGAAEIFDIEKPNFKSDKILIEMDVTGIYEIDVYGGADFYRITKDITEIWKINDTLSANQLVVENYTAQFEKIVSDQYIETAIPPAFEDPNPYKLVIKSADERIDVELIFYKVTKGVSAGKFMIRSNQHQNLYFLIDSEQLKSKIIWEQHQFQ